MIRMENNSVDSHRLALMLKSTVFYAVSTVNRNCSRWPLTREWAEVRSDNWRVHGSGAIDTRIHRPHHIKSLEQTLSLLALRW